MAGLRFAAFFTALFIIGVQGGLVAGTSARSDMLLPAFPGAQGAGKYATGGRGGDVYVVENTHTSGPGSLAYGIETANAPRTIVFNTGGTIRFGGHLNIRDKNRLTIAGQTAPGDGITLRFDDGGLRIRDSEHIIVQHLRLADGSSATEQDVLRTDGSRHVMLSHLSIRWGARGNFVSRPDGPLTVQYSFNAEPTRRGLAGWFGHMRQDEGHYNQTIYKNLGIHQAGRLNMFQRGRFEFINNVTYNGRSRRPELGPYYIMSRPWHGTEASSIGPQLVEANVIGNVMIDGAAPPAYTFGFGRASRVFIAGNMRDRNSEGPFSPEPADDDIGAGPSHARGDEFERVPRPLDLELTDCRRTVAVSARQAYIDVLSRGGASAARDAHDHRYVRDVMNKHGEPPADLDAVPGEPFADLDAGQPWVSTAGDGIPDQWKTAHGLDPNVPYHQRYNAEGYTYLEVYLHSLARHSFVPDASKVVPIQITVSDGAGAAGVVDSRGLKNVSDDELLHLRRTADGRQWGVLWFDLSAVEPGMLNDASLEMNVTSEAAAAVRLYGLEYGSDKLSAGNTSKLTADKEIFSQLQDDLILLGDVNIEGDAAEKRVMFDNPNLAVFLNLAVYAQHPKDRHRAALVLKPLTGDGIAISLTPENSSPRLLLEGVPKQK